MICYGRVKVDRVDYFISYLLIPTHTVSSDVEQSSESYILEAVPVMLYALLIHHHSFQHIGGGKYFEYKHLYTVLQHISTFTNILERWVEQANHTPVQPFYLNVHRPENETV